MGHCCEPGYSLGLTLPGTACASSRNCEQFLMALAEPLSRDTLNRSVIDVDGGFDVQFHPQKCHEAGLQGPVFRRRMLQIHPDLAQSLTLDGGMMVE